MGPKWVEEWGRPKKWKKAAPRRGGGHTGCRITRRGVLTAPKPPPENIEGSRGPKTPRPSPLSALEVNPRWPWLRFATTTYQPQEEAAADCWTSCSHAVSFSG